jgi:hypothetical protein
MPLACPTCVADAPLSVVWSLLDPARLDEWWDARTRRVTPRGPLAPGQRIEALAGPLGPLAVTLDVLEVDPAAHRVRFRVRMPFGITNDQTTTLTPLGPGRCRIGFG